MLHILWMLIKFILILLGILLGLVLLLALLILFCPVRYRAAAKKEGVPFSEAHAEGRVSWLFGGIAVIYCYKSRAGTLDVRILGIPVLKLMEKLKSRKTSGKASAEKKKDFLTEEPPREDRSERLSSKETEEPSEEPVSDEKPKEKISAAGNNDSRSEIPSPGKNKITLFWEKLKEIFQKLRDIPGVFHKISLTNRRICDKIDSWKAFAEHPRVKAGFALLKNRSMKLIHHIFPRKLKGRVCFGSEDPSVTGAALAVLGMTMPLHKNRVEIQPIFENRNFLEGNIMIRGRIYMIVPAVILLELYFNKNIKYIISRWKHKEV